MHGPQITRTSRARAVISPNFSPSRAIKAMHSQDLKGHTPSLLRTSLMSLIQKPPQKHQTKHNKKRLSQEQLMLLESSFNHEKKLQPERKIQLARDLGLQPRQVAIWYQNKRARWKTQTLERDHKAICSRLDRVLAEKKSLEKEVEKLKGELAKAHEMLRSNILPFSSFLPPSEEELSSTLHGEVNCWEEKLGCK